MQTARFHIKVWVADQSGLPPVLVRGLRDVTSDALPAIHTEVNVTDINAPITIEPPE